MHVQHALAHPGAASAGAILSLQRSGGNRAVQRLLADRVQRQDGVGPEGGELDPGLSRTIQAARGGGHALEPRLGSQVGQRLGADLSGVRVHTDSQADQLNRSMGANAFTYGRDIFFRQGHYNPGSASGQRLVAHELTHVVQQGGARRGQVQPKLSVGPADDRYEREADAVAEQAANRQPAYAPGARRIQRWPFSKKKKNKNKPDPANDTLKQTGQAPPETLFIVRAAVKTQTKARGNASLSEVLGGGGGHSWLEIQLGPAFKGLDEIEENAEDGDMLTQAMGEPTRRELDNGGVTTAGFYPAVAGAVRKEVVRKQFFKNIPGKIIEPEQAHFAGSERGAKGFAITDSAKAIDLFAFINAHRTGRPYNIMRYNCTDFVIKALKRLGFSVGSTSNVLGWTVPALLYKQIYKQAELGDESAKYTELKPGTNRAGKRYDLKHASKKTEKRLTKKARKRGLERRSEAEARAQAEAAKPKVIREVDVPSFLTIQSGGMLRPGAKIGLTGNIVDGRGEIVLGGTTLDYVLLDEYERVVGEPYPGAERADAGGDAEEDIWRDDDLEEDVGGGINIAPEDLPPQQMNQLDELLPEPTPDNPTQAPPELDGEPPQEDQAPGDITAYLGQVVTLTRDISLHKYDILGNVAYLPVPAGVQVFVYKLEEGEALVDAGRDRGRGYISPALLLAALQPG